MNQTRWKRNLGGITGQPEPSGSGSALPAKGRERFASLRAEFARSASELTARLRKFAKNGSAALRRVGGSIRRAVPKARRRPQTAARKQEKQALRAEKRERRLVARQSTIDPAFTPLALPPISEEKALPFPAPEKPPKPRGSDRPSELRSLPVKALRRSPPGPRRDFEDTALLALADSIRLHGLLVPLLVRETGDPEAPYTVLSGHRRLRALEILGRTHADCLILPAEAEAAALIPLLDNLHRRPLTLFEEAEAEAALPGDAATLATALSLPQEQMFARGRLLQFSPKERRLIRAAELPEESAVALAAISDPVTRMAALEDLCRRIGERGGRDGIASLLQASAASAKLADGRKRLLMRDLRLFYNSIDRAVAAVRETGLRVRYDVRDEGDRQVIEITLLREESENVSGG